MANRKCCTSNGDAEVRPAARPLVAASHDWSPILTRTCCHNAVRTLQLPRQQRGAGAGVHVTSPPAACQARNDEHPDQRRFRMSLMSPRPTGRSIERFHRTIADEWAYARPASQKPNARRQGARAFRLGQPVLVLSPPPTSMAARCPDHGKRRRLHDHRRLVSAEIAS